mgnify:CR=1 FL=1
MRDLARRGPRILAWFGAPTSSSVHFTVYSYDSERAFIQWQSLSLARRVGERPNWVRGAGLIALACHTLIVALAIVGPHGLHLGLTQSAALVGWLVVALRRGRLVALPLTLLQLLIIVDLITASALAAG